MSYSKLFKVSFVKGAGVTTGALSVFAGFGFSLLVTTKTISRINNTIKKIKMRKLQKKIENEKKANKNNNSNINNDTCHWSLHKHY